MRARRWVPRGPRQWRRWGRGGRRAAAALGPACRRLADRLAYRPREVVVVGLLAGGLCGGLAVERWRARHPETAARLEAEPARGAVLVATPTMPRPRPRPPPRREPRLDLNRATPAELARLAGISWRLAARIVAARDAFEQTGVGDAADLSPRGRPARIRRGTLPAPPPVEPEPAPEGARDPEPFDGSPATPPE